MDFRPQNEYFGTYNGQEIVIYAGEKLAPDTNGAWAPGCSCTPVIGGGLRISLGNSGTMTDYLDSTSPGWVAITAVDEDIVSLVRQDGSEVTFNLADDSFSS